MRQLSLRWLLLAMVLALPLAGLLFLRMYESALIRRTESELIAQSAVLAVAYRRSGSDTILDRIEGTKLTRQPGPSTSFAPISIRSFVK